VAPSLKRQALLDLLYAAPPCRTIIFVNSKRTADEIDDYLFNVGMPVTAIHGDRTQREREDSIRAFRSGKCPILIATGVSARGLDIHSVMHGVFHFLSTPQPQTKLTFPVINFDLPSHMYGGIEEYTHRIGKSPTSTNQLLFPDPMLTFAGRTGRIGNFGLATSFYTDRDEDLAQALVNTLLETHQVIPDFLDHLIPEGFTADGQGDEALLKFDADSDNEEEEIEAAADSGNNAWGAAPTTDEQPAAAWGAPAAAQAESTTVSQPAASGWGAPVPAPAAAAVESSWGAPAPAAAAPAPASGGWGAATGGSGW
jgi:ATP-dependent RNA helicase DDX3X